MKAVILNQYSLGVNSLNKSRIKSRIATVACASVLFLTACASVVTQPDWKFIQSVGGLTVGQLEMIDGIYYLPVNMSVASHSKPAMVCVDTAARVAGKQIFLSVQTDSRENQPNASSECPKARIGGIPDGNYRVMYRGPEGNMTKVGDVVADLANVPVGSL